MEIQDIADLGGPTMHLRSRRLGEVWHWVQLLAARLYNETNLHVTTLHLWNLLIHAPKNLNTIQSFCHVMSFLTSSTHRCILYVKVPALDPTNTSPQPCHRERTCNRFPECRRPDKVLSCDFEGDVQVLRKSSNQSQCQCRRIGNQRCIFTTFNQLDKKQRASWEKIKVVSLGQKTSSVYDARWCIERRPGFWSSRNSCNIRLGDACMRHIFSWIKVIFPAFHFVPMICQNQTKWNGRRRPAQTKLFPQQESHLLPEHAHLCLEELIFISPVVTVVQGQKWQAELTPFVLLRHISL